MSGLIIESPYKKIERPKINRPEVHYLKTLEISIFLKAAQTYKEPKGKVPKISIHALFFTAIFTGMRRGELLGP
jgi:integrase